jgi:flagellar hook assembly protein FlgD
MSKFNIQRYKETLVLAFATDNNSIESSAVQLNGLLSGVVVQVPDLESTNTATINIKDASGNVVYTKASLAESSTTQAYVDGNNHPLRIPLSGNYTIELVTSGNQTANRTFTVDLLINRGV